MAAWKDVEQAEPGFAARVRQLFDAGRHKTIATLRADGSPRISGIECEFADGELRFGSMPGARKGADLRRDPRFALHGPTFHPQDGKEAEWPGEAKIAGRAVPAGPIGDGPDGDVFLIPRGYHGPSVAAPGYPMYYLNVLAGPAAERTMAFRDDPDHHWVRDSWADQAADPRVPLTTAAGRTDRGDAMSWEPSG